MSQPKGPSIAGDWDAYVASGSTPRPGFEGWRRMGFAHFASGDSGIAGSIRRRTGEPMLEVTGVAARGDSLTLSGTRNQSIDATWHGDTLAGVMLANGKPSGRRIRLVRRTRRSWRSSRTRCGPAPCPIRSTPSPKTRSSS